MKPSKKLIFFGNERLATGVTTTAPVLQALIEAGYEITAVIANHRDPVSRQKRDLEIGPVAQAHGIPVILPGEKCSLASKVEKHLADAGILVAFGQIISQEVIDLFPSGIINIHPSMLPEYRGPTPIERAILDGASQTGVSLMKLQSKMDAGPIYAQKTLRLTGNETKQQLADNLLDLGKELLLQHLEAILDGSLQPKAQLEAKATYTSLLSKDDGLISWSKPAQQIEKEVRAYAGFPKSRTNISGNDVIVTKTRLAKDKNDGDLVMACGEGSFLEILELVAPSGKTILGAEFLRGYQKT